MTKSTQVVWIIPPLNVFTANIENPRVIDVARIEDNPYQKSKPSHSPHTRLTHIPEIIIGIMIIGRKSVLLTFGAKNLMLMIKNPIIAG